MSMSDCPKCWETPCACGYEYRHKSRAQRIELAAAILGAPKEQLEALMGEAIPAQHPRHDEV